MVSEKIKQVLDEVQAQLKRDSKYIELVSTVEYLIELVEPSKRDMFKEALENAETIEDVNELIKALKLQIGAQGAKKYALMQQL
ncbi:hypothetical protein [Methanotorris igneus]|uniref:Uncharacterized protein n=1 Tax=Methanotorris igneus (strain DSM 5666 / JCM 11834 / Kol 5) TaxID=880724 RepID=F6BB73_METIK|nr:hypothetical protein [Methanotorris igneus]AEF95958.1 hypothetical protein Metig_0402 [Methanotorris igneus Kol 5]